MGALPAVSGGYTIEEMAFKFGVSKCTISRWIRDGYFKKVFYINGCLAVNENEVEQAVKMYRQGKKFWR